MSKSKIIISGGGTGGHIFPAIAIADAFKKVNPEAEILFVGARGKMEMEKVPQAGYPIQGIWVSGWQRNNMLKNLLFPIKVGLGLLKASWIILKFKPAVVIGVGGYASGLIVRMAAFWGIPTLIQEQNSYPGMTNRLLAKKVKRICVAFPNMEAYFPAEKIIVTGNPIREVITQTLENQLLAREKFQLDPTKKTLLVVGGSLGARTLNTSVLQGLHSLQNHGIQCIWQTGKSFENEALAACEKVQDQSIKAMAFIPHMELAYAAADLIVSRAGAISISELCQVGKAVVLVPSPNVTDDHQTKNALALVSQQAACLIKDAEANEKLLPKVLELLNNTKELEILAHNIKSLSNPHAAEAIVTAAQQIMKPIHEN